jgi:dTDP-4-dehydrorhamnose reductase
MREIKRVMVTGAGGQLGSTITAGLSRRYDVAAFTRAQLDIGDEPAVLDLVAAVAPDALINCAAYNDVEGAEDAAVEALAGNALGVLSLCRAAAASSAILVHYSTDFVFDGAASAPYTEEDRPNPRSVYAASKLLGEWFAADAPRAYVLRVESLFGRAPGGPAPKGSVTMIVESIRAGREVRVFEDRTISPTFIIDAARATRGLVEQQAAPGIYHCVNSGRCTWLELAQEVARQLGPEGRDPRITPVRAAETRMRAQRPQFCALSNDKLRAAGVAMPSWQDALARYMSSLSVT